MARTFRRQRSSHAIAEINVTNLIDLGFTLLIIFMISTPLINQEQTIPIRLPVESKSTQQKPDPSDQFESVSIDSQGNFYVEQTIPIRLPVESKSTQQKPDPSDQFESVSIDSQGNFYVNSQKTPLSVVQLRSVLQTWGVMKKPPVVRIRGDGKVPYEKVVQLMDELKKANLMRTTFDTQSDS